MMDAVQDETPERINHPHPRDSYRPGGTRSDTRNGDRAVPAIGDDLLWPANQLDHLGDGPSNHRVDRRPPVGRARQHTSAVPSER